LCTGLDRDPEQIVRWFVQRWRVEVTFQETRAHVPARAVLDRDAAGGPAQSLNAPACLQHGVVPQTAAHLQ
jgi:hypothetical protein